MDKVLNGVVAITAGVGATLLIFWALNWVVEHLPEPWRHRLQPWVFAGPAVAFIGVFLVYPAVRTVVISFLDADGEAFVGLGNYVDLFTDPAFQQTLLNTLLWLIVVPTGSVILGLLVAVLADRLPLVGERVSKSLIFLPMAISMVGAATIWRFVYEFRPPGEEQIGLLNAIATGLRLDPVVWIQVSEGRLNSFLLMVILVWLQVGFAMVLLSAAIKGVPEDTIEAARVDGATEVQAFFRVIVPQIWGTVVTVFVTILIAVLKIFDIVYVMTNGNFNTDVVANSFFKELFEFSNDGRSAAIVVILLLAVIPAMIYQIRRFRAEEALR
jgi:alpha-glucoside transport system permease protein